MSLDAIVRAGLATAKKITADLQVDVTHAAWTGVDGYALPTFASAITRKAIVERRQRIIRTTSGETVMSRATVLFLEPIKKNGASGRTEPIDPRDVITLPDGTTGPIVDVNGLMDPTTDRPYYAEVFIGDVAGGR